MLEIFREFHTIDNIENIKIKLTNAYYQTYKQRLSYLDQYLRKKTLW